MASKKDFINLHSDAFDTVFGGNLVMPKNFAFFQKLLDKCFYKFDNPEINRQEIFPASLILRTLKTGKTFK